MISKLMRSTVLALLLVCTAASVPATAAAKSTIGAGNQPDAVSDTDGNTHVVWDVNGAPIQGGYVNDLVRYCRIARGHTACDKTVDLALPGGCVKRDVKQNDNFWEGDRPRVFVSRFGDIHVASHGICRLPVEQSDPWKYQDTMILYTSTDGGDSFDLGVKGAARINSFDQENQPGGPPVKFGVDDDKSDSVYDEADSRLVTVANADRQYWENKDTASPGVYILGGEPATGRLNAAYANNLDGDSQMQIVQRGRGSFVAAWLHYSRDTFTSSVRFRTFQCAECGLSQVSNAASWTPEVTIDDAQAFSIDDLRLVSGPSGTFIFYRRPDAAAGNRNGWFMRRITGGAAGPVAHVISATDAAPSVSPATFAEDPATGRLHMGYDSSDNNGWHSYRHLFSDDAGQTWTAPVEIDHDYTGSFPPVMTANTGDNGFMGMLIVGNEPLIQAQNKNYTIDLRLLPGIGELPPDPPVTPTPTPTDPGTPGLPGLPSIPGVSTDPGAGGTPIPGLPSIPGLPTPTVQVPETEACRVKQFGPIEVLAEACLKVEKDGVFVATGTVKVNGLQLAGKEIRFDPKKRLVQSVGPVSFKLGDTKLFSIPIDWKIPAGSTFNLPSIDLGGADKLLGFPLQGSVDVKFVRGGVEVPLHLGLPALFGGFTGDVTVRADNLTGIRLRELKVKAGSALIGPLQLKDVSFEYQPDDKRWAGAATLILPPKPPSPALSANVAFQDGELASLGAQLEFPGDGILLDSFNLTHLTKIRFSMELKPELKLVGGVSFGVGKKFGDIWPVDIDGDLTFRFPHNAPAIMRAEGRLKLLSIPIGGSYAQFQTDGHTNFGGNIDYHVGSFGVTGKIDGWIMPPFQFSVLGSARVCLGDLKCQGGDIAVSSKGMAACAKTDVLDFGAGYEWGPSLLWAPALLLDIDYMFSGCDVGPYTIEEPGTAARASRLQAGAPRTVEVAKGLPSVVLGVTGQGAAPHVALVGPGGQRIEAPANGPLDTPQAISFHVPEKNTTFFAVKKPAAGTWQIQSLDATPIVTVKQAAGLPKPNIKAHVTKGKGRARVLEYSVEQQKGMSVRFEERAGTATAGVIGNATRAKGTLKFTPTTGKGGKRDIVAIVESFGKPRAQLVVGSYTAPPPPVPLKPKSLAIKRRGSGLSIAWKAQPGLLRYQLKVMLSDGRTLLLLPKGGAHAAKVPGVKKTVRASITLLGELKDGTTGPSATAKVK